MCALYSEPSMNIRPRTSFEAFRPRANYAGHVMPVKDINSRKPRGTFGESSGKKKPAVSGGFLFHGDQILPLR
jgi:hypothetical protein